MNKVKSIILKCVISVCFALPIIYIIHDKMHKYNVKIELLKNFTTASRVIDLDNDGYTEELTLGNIDKDNFYGEVWNVKSLLGVIHDKANVLKHTLKVQDLDKDSITDYCYLSCYNDTLYLKRSDIRLKDNKIQPSKKSSIVICPLVINDAQPECFKSELLDVDGDNFDDYIFTLFHSPKHRCVYYYNFKKKKLFKSDNEFMVVTDFHKLTINSKNVILYTTYANGNIPNDKLKLAATKFKMDSLHSERYFSDYYSYIGYFNETLRPVGKPKMREGFTSMIRAIPVVKGKDVIYYTSETYINEPDSLQTLKILDQNLNTLLSTKMLLPFKNDLYHKYSREVFQKITINTIDKIILCGRNDSVYELSPELKLNFLFTDSNIKEGSKVKQIDLDTDGVMETIFFSASGLTIFSNGLNDKIFVESPGGGISYNAAFDKNGKKEQRQGFYLKTEDKKLVFLSYAHSPFYKFKIVFCLLSIIIFYLLISFIIKMQTKKLEKEKTNLELVIKERTQEISNKNAELGIRNNVIEQKQKEILDSIHYAKRIQSALLANKELVNAHLPESFFLFQPKDIVSGDFYWAAIHSNKFYLTVCDSTGHGVPGAFMSLLNMCFLNEAIKEKNIIEPHEVLNYVRKRLIESIGNEGQQDGMDAILICMDNTQEQDGKKIMTYAAANNAPILISRNNSVKEIVELPKDKMPVGKGEKVESFSLFEINGNSGDTLYLYTDGYADQFGGAKGKKFKYKQLNDLLLSNSSLSLNAQSEILMKDFINWKGDLEQVDDVCVIGIKL